MLKRGVPHVTCPDRRNPKDGLPGQPHRRGWLTSAFTAGAYLSLHEIFYAARPNGLLVHLTLTPASGDAQRGNLVNAAEVIAFQLDFRSADVFLKVPAALSTGDGYYVIPLREQPS